VLLIIRRTDDHIRMLGFMSCRFRFLLDLFLVPLTTALLHELSSDLSAGRLAPLGFVRELISWMLRWSPLQESEACIIDQHACFATTWCVPPAASRSIWTRTVQALVRELQRCFQTCVWDRCEGFRRGFRLLLGTGQPERYVPKILWPTWVKVLATRRKTAREHDDYFGGSWVELNKVEIVLTWIWNDYLLGSWIVSRQQGNRHSFG
jgi:hypothetical protein